MANLLLNRNRCYLHESSIGGAKRKPNGSACRSCRRTVAVTAGVRNRGRETGRGHALSPTLSYLSSQPPFVRNCDPARQCPPVKFCGGIAQDGALPGNLSRVCDHAPRLSVHLWKVAGQTHARGRTPSANPSVFPKLPVFSRTLLDGAFPTLGCRVLSRDTSYQRVGRETLRLWGFPFLSLPFFFLASQRAPGFGGSSRLCRIRKRRWGGNRSGMTRTLMAPKSSVRFRRMGRVLCVVSHFAHIFRVSLHQRPFPFPSRRPLVPELASIHPHLPDEASLGISVMPICHGFVSPDANRIHCG